MTIKSSMTAVIAVFSAVLFFGPAAQAKERPSTDKDQTPPTVKVIIKEGDTLSSIADAYKTTYIRIFNANESIQHPDVINAGVEVRIPTETEELPDRFSAITTPPVVAATPASTAVSAASPTAPAPSYQAVPRIAASSAGNTYYQGYCTWYAKERRPDLPNMLGNGGQWVANAAARGYATGSEPRAGAIAEMPGHVAYVERVNGDGTIVISEMNGYAGFGVVGTRTAPASQFRYIY